jgi:hypothetical protein
VFSAATAALGSVTCAGMSPPWVWNFRAGASHLIYSSSCSKAALSGQAIPLPPPFCMAQPSGHRCFPIVILASLHASSFTVQSLMSYIFMLLHSYQDSSQSHMNQQHSTQQPEIWPKHSKQQLEVPAKHRIVECHLYLCFLFPVFPKYDCRMTRAHTCVNRPRGRR